MKEQQKLIIGILLADNKINHAQFNKALATLETLPSTELAKLNWISQEFQLSKDDIMSVYQKSRALSIKHGTSTDAFISLDLPAPQTSIPQDISDKKTDSITGTDEKRLTESEIAIQKGPTRLGKKSTYQTAENFSKIKHKPKLKVQHSLKKSPSRFVDLDVSESDTSSKDEGLFKSSESSRPLSDIQAPQEQKPKLKRAASKIIEPKSEQKPDKKLVLEAPPQIEEKERKAFEIEQIQCVPQNPNGEILKPPPPIMPADNIEDLDVVELEAIDDLEEIVEIDDLDEIEEINSAPPMLNSANKGEIIELPEDEIDEIETDDSKSKSNRLRPRSRRHRRR
ncbi:MAG: hypothetical protein K8S87_01425 [Planctomycetes bacterium]|nr:hypothetical protein [Planctomycetota bacterium]